MIIPSCLKRFMSTLISPQSSSAVALENRDQRVKLSPLRQQPQLSFGSSENLRIPSICFACSMKCSVASIERPFIGRKNSEICLKSLISSDPCGFAGENVFAHVIFCVCSLAIWSLHGLLGGVFLEFVYSFCYTQRKFQCSILFFLCQYHAIKKACFSS